MGVICKRIRIVICIQKIKLVKNIEYILWEVESKKFPEGSLARISRVCFPSLLITGFHFNIASEFGYGV
jgi:hypothetical protein